MQINFNYFRLNNTIWKKQSQATVASLTLLLHVRGSGSVAQGASSIDRRWPLGRLAEVMEGETGD
jgi:hypothetical protein